MGAGAGMPGGAGRASPNKTDKPPDWILETGWISTIQYRPFLFLSLSLYIYVYIPLSFPRSLSPFSFSIFYPMSSHFSLFLSHSAPHRTVVGSVPESVGSSLSIPSLCGRWDPFTGFLNPSRLSVFLASESFCLPTMGVSSVASL